MPTKSFNPITKSRRYITVLDYSELTRTAPQKSLTKGKKSTGGRNSAGRITTRFRGNGNKRRYRMIDFKRTKAGAVVGWIYDDKKPYGDNFVDFGMTEIRRHDTDSDEYKRAFILDFNVVGDITSKIVDHQNDYLA